MLYLNILYTALLSAICYILLNEYDLFIFKNRFKKIWINRKIDLFINRHFKGRWVENIDLRIKKAGNPYGVSAGIYIALKLVLTVISTIYVLSYKMFDIQGVLLIGLSFFALDIYLYFSERDRKNVFKKEFPEVVDLFEIGATAGIDIGNLFLMAVDFVEGGEFKKALAELSAEYFITRDKEVCLKRFCEVVDIPEADILTLALLQGEKTGKVEGVISSLSSSLFNSVIAKVNRDDKAVDYKVLFAAFAIMAAIFSLIVFPYFTTVNTGIQSLF